MPARKRPVHVLTALSLTAAVLTAPLLATPSSAAEPLPAKEVLRNGTFDSNLDHWGTNKSHIKLYRSSSSKQGSHSVRLKTTKDGSDVVLNDMPNTISSTRKNVAYDVSAWVRSPDPKLSGQVRVREVRPNGAVETFAKSFYLDGKDWTKVDFSFATASSGDSLDLSVVGWKLKKGQRLYVDGVSMVEKASTEPVSTAPTTPVPSTPAPSTPAPATPTQAPAPRPTTGPAPTDDREASSLTLSNGVVLSTRGIPASGALVGAAVGSNTDPVPFEGEAGQRLGVRRTYWGADGTDKAVKAARNDLANGRLPWISFRLPYSWERMAAGEGDAWAKNIAVKLSQLPGPVWVAFYHEPETHGDVQQWKAMQERLGPIVRSNASNVAFTIILTGYHQISGEKAYSLEALWPNTKVDVAGFDIYNFYKTTNKSGTTFTKPSDLRGKYFEPISKFVASKGSTWGLAETGFNDAAAQDLPNLMKETYDAMVDNNGVAFSYFNSNLNSSSSWAISTPEKMKQFKSLVSGSPMYPRLASS